MRKDRSATPTVLIVDDRAVDREFLATLLRYGGYESLQAGDGIEALEVAATHRPDLVIADVLMPSMDGYELVRRMRATSRLAETPVIFYTASYHEPEARSLASSCGVLHVITKPCEPRALLKTIAGALDTAPTTAPLGPGGDFEHRRLALHTHKIAKLASDSEMACLRLEALLDLGRRMVLEHDPESLLRSYVHAARDLIAAHTSALGIIDEGGQRLSCCFSAGLEQDALAALTASGPRDGLLGQVLDRGRPLRVGSRDGKGLTLSGIQVRTFLGVPISSATRTYGWLILVDKLGRSDFSEADERLAAALAAQAAFSYENARLYHELNRRAGDLEREVAERRAAQVQIAQSREQLRALSAHLQSVREDEQARIARELHDDLGQALTCLKMDVSWLADRIPPDTPGTARPGWREKIVAIRELVDETIVRMRGIVAQLRPSVLDDLGLLAAVEWQVRDFEKRTGVTCRLRSSLRDGDVATIGRERSTAIFRILQEILTNVTRHARARRVEIRLRRIHAVLTMEVSDDGAGVTDEALGNPRSFGILGMRERAQLMGGQLTIQGRPTRGTTVGLRVPLTERIDAGGRDA